MATYTERRFDHQDVKNLPYGTDFQLFLSDNLLPVFNSESGFPLTRENYNQDTVINEVYPNEGLQDPTEDANDCFATIPASVSDEITLSDYIARAGYAELFPKTVDDGGFIGELMQAGLI